MTKRRGKFALRDKIGKTYIRGSFNDCIAELHKQQDKDWHEAMREGWSVDKLDNKSGKTKKGA